MTTVIVTTAEEQLFEIHDWWIANRTTSPTLVLDELERCVALLESSPDIGMRFIARAFPACRDS